MAEFVAKLGLDSSAFIGGLESAAKATGTLSSGLEKVSTDAQKLGGGFKGAGGDIDNLKTKVAGLGASLNDVGSIGKNAFAFLGAGAVTAAISGLGNAFTFVSEKAHEADQAADTLNISLVKAGLSAGEAAKEQERLGQSAKKTADDFALPTIEVAKLQAKIAGFGGITGQQLDKLTEFSIGAANALDMPAEAVAKLIAKGADEEQQGKLSKLGIVFDKNASAAERMAIVQAKLGPVVEATKASTQDSIGAFDRIKNTIQELSVTIGSKLFDVFAPVFEFIGSNIQAFVPPLIDAFSALFNTLSEAGAAISEAFSAFGEGAGSIDLASGAMEILQGVFDGVTIAIKVVSSTIAGIISAFGQLYKAIFGPGESAGNTISSIKSTLDLIRPVIGAVTVALVAWYGALAISTAYTKAAELATKGFQLAKAAYAFVTGAATVATEGQTIAQWSLNAALLANPIGAVIAAVAGLAAGYALLSESASEVAQKQLENAEAGKKVVESQIEQNKQQTESQQNTKKLADEYEKLATKTNRTQEENKKLKSIQEQLDKQYPDLIDQTKSFAENLDGVRAIGEETTKSLDGLAKQNVVLQKQLVESTNQIAYAQRNVAVGALQDAISDVAGFFSGPATLAAEQTLNKFQLANKLYAAKTAEDVDRIRTSWLEMLNQVNKSGAISSDAYLAISGAAEKAFSSTVTAIKTASGEAKKANEESAEAAKKAAEETQKASEKQDKPKKPEIRDITDLIRAQQEEVNKARREADEVSLADETERAIQNVKNQFTDKISAIKEGNRKIQEDDKVAANQKQEFSRLTSERIIELEKQLQEKIEDIKEKQTSKELAAEKKRADEIAKLRQEAEDEAEQARQELAERRRKRIEKETQEAEAKRQSIVKAFTDAVEELRQKAADNALDIAKNTEALDAEEAALLKSLRNREISYEEYSQRIADIDARRAELQNDSQQSASKVLQTEFSAVVKGLNASLAETFKQTREDADREFKATAESGQANFGALAKSATMLFGELVVSGASAADAAKQVAIQTAATLLDTFVAPMIASYISFLGPFAVPVALAAVGALKALFNSAVSGFREGGYTGNAGEGDVAGVVHGREFVHTAEVTRKYRPMFEHLHKGGELSSWMVNMTGNLEPSRQVNMVSTFGIESRLDRLETAIVKSSKRFDSMRAVKMTVEHDPTLTIKAHKRDMEVRSARV